MENEHLLYIFVGLSFGFIYGVVGDFLHWLDCKRFCEKFCKYRNGKGKNINLCNNCKFKKDCLKMEFHKGVHTVFECDYFENKEKEGEL